MKNKFLEHILPVSLITLLLCSAPIHQAQAKKRTCRALGTVEVTLPAVAWSAESGYSSPNYINYSQNGLNIRYVKILVRSNEALYSPSSRQDLISIKKDDLTIITNLYDTSQTTKTKGTHSCG